MTGPAPMALSAGDRIAIHEVIALHSYLSEVGAEDRFDEVFTPDLVVDVAGIGLQQPRELAKVADPSGALDAYIAAGRRRGPGTTVAVHVSNVVVSGEGDIARAWSKGLTVDRSGSCASFTYQDRLVRTSRGWRIRHRTVTARSEPRTGVAPPPTTG